MLLATSSSATRFQIQSPGTFRPEMFSTTSPSKMRYRPNHPRKVAGQGNISTMPTATRVQDVRKELEPLARAVKSRQDLMSQIVNLQHERMLKYNWVGLYLLEPAVTRQPPMLALGPFQGAMTPHTRIPLHQGICGAAASTGKTVIVDDVTQDSRYLACSIETKSEIGVPVFVQGKVVGDLDIDSHFPAAFQDEDREPVEYCAALVGERWERSQA
jgi:L-methionine (R)-S-oxide reductase